MTEVVESNRELLEEHAEKNLPTAPIAEALLEITEESDN